MTADIWPITPWGMTSMSRAPDEVKKLATWALKQGALYVKVDDFEMSLPPQEPTFPQLTKDGDMDEAPDPETQRRRLREQYFDLMTHSG